MSFELKTTLKKISLWMCCVVKIQITGNFSHIVSSFLLGRRSTAHSGKVSWEILTIMAMTVRDGGSWRRRGSEKQKIGNSDLTLYAKVASFKLEEETSGKHESHSLHTFLKEESLTLDTTDAAAAPWHCQSLSTEQQRGFATSLRNCKQ